MNFSVKIVHCEHTCVQSNKKNARHVDRKVKLQPMHELIANVANILYVFWDESLVNESTVCDKYVINILYTSCITPFEINFSLL